MGRPRATAAARSRRANPKPKRSFLSPLAPAATATRKRAGSGSSPSSPNSPTDLRFISSPGSPGSSASPKPAPKSRSSKRTARTKPAARSPLSSPRPATPLPADAAGAAPAPAASAAVSSVGDLRSAAASQMEALKRRLDALHSRAHTDLDTSLSRASKRFQTQNQVCQQLTDEMDKEYKKMSDGIKKNTEMIKAKYKQIMAEAQSSTSRVCKVTIPEMTKSVEKAIDSLRSRYNISMPA